MKKFGLLLFVMIWSVVYTARAQGKLIKKFKEKVQDRVEQRIDEGMDKSIDKAEETAKNSSKAKGDDKKAASPVKSADPVPGSGPSFKSYSRYDFIPGENILYAEDFSQDVIGEFPLKWSTNSRGEVVTIEGKENKWLRLFPGGRVVSPPLKSISDTYTLEFDFLINVNGDEGYVIPELTTKLIQTMGAAANGNRYFESDNSSAAVTFTLEPVGEDDLRIGYRSTNKGNTHLENEWKSLKTTGNYQEKVHHIAIWVQKERLRLWVNGEKAYDMPQAVPAKMLLNRLEFEIPSSIYSDENLGIYISDIKVAEGAPDMRSKLITEGKLVTNGILFDVNSDKIKAESYGVLKEIAAVLKDNPTIRVKVIGHTDSDGDDSKNMDLSKRRSASVKKAMADEFKIEGSRIETDGMGETRPVSDNTTREGKAKNRRVEFIKL